MGPVKEQGPGAQQNFQLTPSQLPSTSHPPRVRTSGPSGSCLGRAAGRVPWARRGEDAAVLSTGLALPRGAGCQVTEISVPRNQSLGQIRFRSDPLLLQPGSEPLAGAVGISHWSLSNVPAVLSDHGLTAGAGLTLCQHLSVPLYAFASFCMWCCKPARPVLCRFVFPFPSSLSCLCSIDVSLPAMSKLLLSLGAGVAHAWGHWSCPYFPQDCPC